MFECDIVLDLSLIRSNLTSIKQDTNGFETKPKH